MTDFYKRSIEAHEKYHGKIELAVKMPVITQDDISLAYTPGVAGPCEEIHANPDRARDLTIKRNAVAVVTDGSAVLGLGNIGALASIPVMEGKALLFKKYANIDAWPICLATQDTQEIINIVRNIAPVFGGINLEDISAPRCFEIEKALQDLGIPVFHDDQHGTAAVVLAGVKNACKALGRKMTDLRVVICGAGAAGIAIAQLIKGDEEGEHPHAVKDVILCDSHGAISSQRTDLKPEKKALLKYTNKEDRHGTIQEVIAGVDLFIGVSKGGLLKAEDVARMAKDPIVFALANPVPEIYPEEAFKGGAAIVATGRSDFPNQVNNVLIFPGIFRGALDSRAPRITKKMILAAAEALADMLPEPTKDKILPHPMDPAVARVVAQGVAKACS